MQVRMCPKMVWEQSGTSKSSFSPGNGGPVGGGERVHMPWALVLGGDDVPTAPLAIVRVRLRQVKGEIGM